MKVGTKVTYKVINIKDMPYFELEKVLNSYSKDGYELKCIDSNNLILECKENIHINVGPF